GSASTPDAIAARPSARKRRPRHDPWAVGRYSHAGTPRVASGALASRAGPLDPIALDPSIRSATATRLRGQMMRTLLVAAVALSACERAGTTPDFGRPELTRSTLDGTTTCVLSKGRVGCRGDNTRGLVGSGDLRRDVEAYRAVRIPTRVVDLAMTPTRNAVCALDVHGDVWCWGINLGLLGPDVPRYRGHAPAPSIAPPTRVAGMPPIASVTLWAFHACAVSRAGQVYCWGVNDRGQVADPHVVARRVVLTPRAVSLPAPAQGMYLQDAQTCALLSDRSLSCWGGNFADDAGRRPLFEPTQVATDVTEVSVDQRSEQSCVVAAGGRQCWSARDDDTDRQFDALFPADLD
ncbi:MAG: hypothetical protein IPL61_17950, partial [Myxococcales bacterium]|nr:hypothetical protein [Myxococcales bacterium]